MKKLLALFLTVTMVFGLAAALAEDAPVKMTLWTFQELHTELYKTMMEKWNAEADKPKLDIDF